jgi:CubicO group peptidase (beta-lactamase class C family)
MNDTSFRFANLDPGKIAVPYVGEFGTYHPLLHYSILRSPAGGLRTSVSDLSRFLIAHMNGGLYKDVRILKEETIDTMHTVQYSSKTYNFQYGLGWQIWKTLTGTHVGHTGGLAGVATKMVFRQSDNTGIIFFTNKEISNSMNMVIFSLIEQLLFWKASGFNAAELHETIIDDTTTNNMHLLTERYTLL